jgi:RNA polymerase sigma factor (sigma-70 family)
VHSTLSVAVDGGLHVAPDAGFALGLAAELVHRVFDAAVEALFVERDVGQSAGAVGAEAGGVVEVLFAAPAVGWFAVVDDDQSFGVQHWETGRRFSEPFSHIPVFRYNETDKDSRLNSSADHERMAAVSRGDLAPMSEIYQTWRRPLFRFFYRLSGKCAAAEDLVHEVFLRMIRFRETYDAERDTGDREGKFEAWMYRIARNAFADFIRRHRLETDPGEGGIEVADGERPTPFEFAARRQDMALLYRALRQLPVSKREVLILTRFEGLSHQQVAAVIGCEAGTVKGRVFRAMKELEENYRHLCREKAS